MAIDNAIYINELDETIPQNSDPRAEGAGQMRATKRALVNTFPNLGGEVTATHDQLNQVATVNITRGMILDWYGPYDNPPASWAFCDGSTLTLDDGTLYTVPDLRNRFVKSVAFDDDGNVTENVGVTGGDNSGIQKHSHKHTHQRGTMEITGRLQYISETWGKMGSAEGAFTYEGGLRASGTPNKTDSSNAGAADFKASNTWTGATTEDATEVGTEGGNQPAYMVLAKIIFVGPYTA